MSAQWRYCLIWRRRSGPEPPLQQLTDQLIARGVRTLGGMQSWCGPGETLSSFVHRFAQRLDQAYARIGSDIAGRLPIDYSLPPGGIAPNCGPMSLHVRAAMIPSLASPSPLNEAVPLPLPFLSPALSPTIMPYPECHAVIGSGEVFSVQPCYAAGGIGQRRLSMVEQRFSPPLSLPIERVREALNESSLKSGWWWRVISRTRNVLFFVLFGLLSYLISIWGVNNPALSDPILKTLVALAGGAAFILSYSQWRLSRQGAAFEKYYDRVQGVNASINSQYSVEYENNYAMKLDHYKNMRVFAQLDNLEYVLGKLSMSGVDLDLVERAVRAFWSDCNSHPWFREKVLFWIGRTEGLEMSKGYHHRTRTVARLVAM